MIYQPKLRPKTFWGKLNEIKKGNSRIINANQLKNSINNLKPQTTNDNKIQSIQKAHTQKYPNQFKSKANYNWNKYSEPNKSKILISKTKYQTSYKKIQGIKKMQNSATCFINTAVQAILDIEDLTDFLQLNYISYLHHPLLYQIKKMYLDCRTETKSDSVKRVITNWQIIDCLRNRKHIKIETNRQGDSIEFLQNLIEEIHKELTGKTRNRNWKNVPEIEKLMLTHRIEMNKCTKCLQESCVDLSGFTLDLVCTNKVITNQTVSQAIKLISRERQQDIPCTYCLNKKSESKYTSDYPKYMLLKISRNSFNNKTKKIERANHRIKPEKIVSITSTSGSKTYSLYGGIVHTGGANTGHYIYITNQNNTWYSISDDKVTEINELQAFEELETNATLLGYKEIIESNSWRKVHDKRSQKSSNNSFQSDNHSEGPKKKLMTSSYPYKNPSKDGVSKNSEKSNIHNPWLEEINLMEKLLFLV